MTNKELTCNQVAALINFYIEDKLNPRLKELIENHLAKCPACRKKITELQKILRTFHNKPEYKTENSKTVDNEFITKLSAYVDNELNTDENIKIKKMTISNPAARKELETMYKYKKFMHSAYEKTKNSSKYDYSRDIIANLQDNTDYTTNYFYKLIAAFFVILIMIISGFVYLYL